MGDLKFEVKTSQSMKDSFQGMVIKVIDDRTVDVNIIQTEVYNKCSYKPVEQICILYLYSREVVGLGRVFSRDLLELVLKNKEVRCYVHFRDDSGRPVTDVVVM